MTVALVQSRPDHQTPPRRVATERVCCPRCGKLWFTIEPRRDRGPQQEILCRGCRSYVTFCVEDGRVVDASYR